MNVDEARKFIMKHFQAHAIKGELKPGRIYDIVEKSPSKLRIRSRGNNGDWHQNLLVDLVTCTSLKYGQFRRADIFWQWKKKDEDPAHTPCSSNGGFHTAPDPISLALEFDEFDADGLPLAVDQFIERGLKTIQPEEDS